MKVYGMDLLDIGKPETETKGVNKKELKQTINAVGLKLAVSIATTTNIPLYGLQIVDGISIKNNDRILVKNQNAAKDNGIYAASSNSWIRVLDTDESDEISSGMTVYVANGVLNGGKQFILKTPNPIILGTTALEFSTILTAKDFSKGFTIVDGIVNLNLGPEFTFDIDNKLVLNNQMILPTTKVVITANYYCNTSDRYIGCRNNTNINLYLSQMTNNNIITIKDELNSAKRNPITVIPYSGDKIDNKANFVISTNSQVITLWYNNHNWEILSK
jgi:hypothetical protein